MFHLFFITSTHSHFLKVIFFHIFGVRPQDHEVFENWGLRDKLFSSKFCSFPLADKDGSIVGLEASDLLGSTCLTDSVYGDTNTNLSLDRLHVFVDGQEHTRVDRKRDVIKEVMVLASDEGLHVGGSVKDCQQTGKGNIGEKQFVRVQGVKSE
jgi:hypothetical protein